MRFRAAAVLIVVLLLILSGCGRRQASHEADSAPGRTEPVTITIAVAGSDALVEVQRRINQELASDPLLTGVTIETIPFSTITMHSLDEITAMLAAGGPDILVTSHLWAKYLWLAEALHPLDEGIAKHPALNHHWQALYPGAIEASTYGGIAMSVPRSIDISGILYNVEYVTAAGLSLDPEWDWNDMITWGHSAQTALVSALAASDNARLRSLARTPGGTQQIVLCQTTKCWIPFIWSNDAEYLDRQTDQPAVTSPRVTQALEWLETQLVRGNMTLDPGAEHRFRQGTAVMKPGSVSDLLTLNSEGLTIGFAPFPRSPYTGNSVAWLDSTVYVVNAKSQNIPAALDFLAVSLSPRGQTLTAVHTLALPVRSDADIPPIPGLPDADAIRAASATARPNHFTDSRDDTSNTSSGTSAIAAFLEPYRRSSLPGVIHIVQEGEVSVGGDFFGSGSTRRPGEQEPPSEAWTQKGGVEITFRSNTSDLLPFVEEFNRSQDDIYVRLVSTDKSSSGYEESVQVGIASGTYDVVDLPPNATPSLIESGSIVSLDRFLAISPIERSYDGGSIDQARVDGVLYWLPLERIVSLVIARFEAWERSGFQFPADGWTWDEYLSWATKVSDPMAGKYGAHLTSVDWLTIARQREPDIRAYPYPEMGDDLRLFKALYDMYPHREESQGALHIIEGVLNGDSLSTIASTSTIASALRRVQEAHAIVYLPVPVTDLASPVATVGFGKRLGIAATSKHQQEAFAFISWLLKQNERVALNPDRLQPGLLPLRMTSEAITALEQHYGPYAGALFGGAFIVPTTSDPELSMQMYALVEQYLTGRATLDDTLSRIKALTRGGM